MLLHSAPDLVHILVQIFVHSVVLALALIQILYYARQLLVHAYESVFHQLVLLDRRLRIYFIQTGEFTKL